VVEDGRFRQAAIVIRFELIALVFSGLLLTNAVHESDAVELMTNRRGSDSSKFPACERWFLETVVHQGQRSGAFDERQREVLKIDISGFSLCF
jgi:hypothetical protein